jgi:hypothetical protein
MNYGQIVFAVGLVAITSLLTYRGGNQFRRRRPRNISAAFGALFDWVGVFTLFLSANLALGAVVIFLLRAVTRRFFALYGLENSLLLVLSAAQAFVFQTWWRHD